MNADQYHRILNTAGVAHLPDWNALTVSGRHRTRWLQGMITQDIKSLQPGEVRYGCLVTVKGKVLTDFQVINDIDGEQYVLVMRTENIDGTIAHLKKFIIAENVELTNQSDNLSLVTIQGANAPTLLGVQSPVAALEIANTTVKAVSHQRTSQPGFDLLVPKDTVPATLEHLVAEGATTVSAHILDAMRIEAAIPLHGTDFDDSTIPQEACLNDALHWSKGCYVGQEVIARLEHRGHTNKELRQLQITGNTLPDPGAAIYPDPGAEKSVGKITSASHIPATGQILALGYVRRSHFEPQTQLAIEVGSSRINATISDRGIRTVVAHAE